MSLCNSERGRPSARVFRRLATWQWCCRLAAWAVLAGSSTLLMAQPPVHYFHRADMPPGVVGYGQLQRGGPLAWHFQPVEISAPEGTRIAMAIDGAFGEPQEAPINVGLLPGRVYRIKVTDIPLQEGSEVFPTIEVINRLYAPVASVARFPVPIQLTREEMELALGGQFIIRVIYLEDPSTALPRAEDPRNQRYFDVAPNQDPLEVADRLGRPMAILRIGSRVPEMNEMTGRFLFDSPPWTLLPPVEQQPTEAVPRAAGSGDTATGSGPEANTTTGQPVRVGVGADR